jgi:hypothetical protein
MRTIEEACQINVVLRGLHRDDIPPLKELRKDLDEACRAGNTKRGVALFEMLVLATILEDMFKDVPRVEDMEIKGTITV